MTMPTTFAPKRFFRVVIAIPQYHHSTDGYIGDINRVEAYCGTLQSAYESMSRYNEHYVDSDCPYAYVVLPNGNKMVYADWDVNSHYSGPIANDWSDIPF